LLDVSAQGSRDPLRDLPMPFSPLTLEKGLVILDSAEGEVAQEETGKSNPQEKEKEDPLSRIAWRPHARLLSFEGTNSDVRRLPKLSVRTR
jgi:hypothetical protein